MNMTKKVYLCVIINIEVFKHGHGTLNKLYYKYRNLFVTTSLQAKCNFCRLPTILQTCIRRHWGECVYCCFMYLSLNRTPVFPSIIRQLPPTSPAKILSVFSLALCEEIDWQLGQTKSFSWQLSQ